MPAIPPLPEREARYERLLTYRDRDGLSMQEIATLETENGRPLTRQQVWNILQAGPPRRPGRPGQTRREEIIERIHRWADRAAAQEQAGRDASTALARAREARRMLADVDLEGAAPSKRRDMPFGHMPVTAVRALIGGEAECHVCRAPLRAVRRPRSEAFYWQHDRSAL